MTWGIPTPIFLQFHVAISLAGIAAGFVILYGMLNSRYLPVWTAGFLATTFLTALTGFPLAPFGLDPPRIVGIFLMCVLAAAGAALYIWRLTGKSRSVYVICSVLALYLNVFVGVVQSFQKIGWLHTLAPTQSELPFAIAQGTTLVVFITLGILARRRFHPIISRPATA